MQHYLGMGQCQITNMIIEDIEKTNNCMAFQISATKIPVGASNKLLRCLVDKVSKKTLRCHNSEISCLGSESSR